MFGMPLAKLVTGLGRPDPTPRTVYVTVHDPDDALAHLRAPGPADGPRLSARLTRAAMRAAHRVRRSGWAVVAPRGHPRRLRGTRHTGARSG
ncbi:MAG: hypothetical protein V9F82_11365 [Dermatophilaceae bacterium]